MTATLGFCATGAEGSASRFNLPIPIHRITSRLYCSVVKPVGIHLESGPVILDRTALVARGRRLEYFTIAWNAFEAVVALISGLLAGSVSLVGFGLDSVIETIPDGILCGACTPRMIRSAASEPN